MTALLDTHFLVWITVESRRLRDYSWLERYRPWTVSPVSFLEAAMLSETGRIELRAEEFLAAVAQDERFRIDEVPLTALIRDALALAWTRDPFDRLLAAHSTARNLALCTVDAVLREHHPLVVRELRT